MLFQGGLHVLHSRHLSGAILGSGSPIRQVQVTNIFIIVQQVFDIDWKYLPSPLHHTSKTTHGIDINLHLLYCEYELYKVLLYSPVWSLEYLSTEQLLNTDQCLVGGGDTIKMCPTFHQCELFPVYCCFLTLLQPPVPGVRRVLRRRRRRADGGMMIECG